MFGRRAFTLIELLVVVAIVAILAAIAIPNFLEAQIRAKVSRALSDMRAVAVGLEAYAVDQADYPPNSADRLGIVPHYLTTPVAYIVTSMLTDPFDSHIFNQQSFLTRYYSYHKMLTQEEWLARAQTGFFPPAESSPLFNPGNFRKYGKWRLVSNGPDGVYGSTIAETDVPYDATNGTKSQGNIFFLQNGKSYPE